MICGQKALPSFHWYHVNYDKCISNRIDLIYEDIINAKFIAKLMFSIDYLYEYKVLHLLRDIRR